MKQTFITWNPSQKTLPLLSTIAAIIEEYESQGYKLTIRQLYYQLVARDHIPNNVREYTKIVNVVSKARLSGLIDWSLIEDRVRTTKKNTHWDSPQEILEASARWYYKDRWENQKYHIEVWSEKDAVSGIVEPVCRELDITYMANRGYSSQSALYKAYQRFSYTIDRGKGVIVLYLGDHDPSGMDMGRDLHDRMNLFLSYDDYEGAFSFQRIGLNLDQIKQYRPPENPAKMTDSRFKSYAARFGTKSWELDALEPSVLSKLVESSVLPYVDHDEFERVTALEAEEKERIVEVAKGL